ncbi:alpha/beta-hydrolase [Glonium stellatum]|uniref:Alpha/beta-hydrolase n=1 Tax=Glonium stellatum TaxID=574774 RepID=A0A8E2FD30_9PEZI|nr:alpha/beta-hydrolase [Glonium stellatum]
MAATSNLEVSTHVYKEVDGLSLTLDVFRPINTSASDAGPQVALIHYHGGFLVIGEKTTFPPSWLINACVRRGWIYITPAYRLLPEAQGVDVVADALDAAKWVTESLSTRLIVAGSSAGGLLALSVATQLTRPLAVLSVYGMLDLTSTRYIEQGTMLMGNPPIPDVRPILDQIEAAKKDAVLDGYPFPSHPPTDKRMLWIAVAHQEAIYPDLLTGHAGLAGMIRKGGIDAIPTNLRHLFPVAFALRGDLPPTAFLHGDDDNAIHVDQSIKVAEALNKLGVKVTCEIVPGKGHGFDVREIPATVDIESDTNTNLPMYKSLRSILAFLDGVVN